MSVAQINGRDLNQVMARLRQRGRMIERAAKLALRQGVNEIVQTAKRLAPVRTGNLRDNIHAEEENNGASYKIVSAAPYSKYVEYDPRINNKPFLYPAIDAEKQRLNDRIKSAVQGEIN